MQLQLQEMLVLITLNLCLNNAILDYTKFMQFIELSTLHSPCSRNNRHLALNEHELALLIQELFGGS